MPPSESPAGTQDSPQNTAITPAISMIDVTLLDLSELVLDQIATRPQCEITHRRFEFQTMSDTEMSARSRTQGLRIMAQGQWCSEDVYNSFFIFDSL